MWPLFKIIPPYSSHYLQTLFDNVKKDCKQDFILIFKVHQKYARHCVSEEIDYDPYKLME